ncbi:MAG: alkaline phosphatase D family protein [Planctomycetota bacterium]
MLVTLFLSLLVSMPPAPETVDRIAFGSCAREDRPMPIWDAVAAAEPDLLIMLGDNVYADTDDLDEFRAKYAQLESHPVFAELRRKVPLLATWDDHDYGRNDAGKEWHLRAEAQQIALDWQGVSETDPRREREGIYHAETFGEPGQRLQVILLDTRYFRDPIKTERINDRRHYVPGPGEMLGDAQWAWLEARLAEPADLRVVCSSIQVLAEEHRFEKWANFPEQRERLMKMLTEAGNVVVISGDRHHGEISTVSGLRDITSSALNQNRRSPVNEPNVHRVGEPIGEANFGLLEIDWQAGTVTATLRRVDGEIAVSDTWSISRPAPTR